MKLKTQLRQYLQKNDMSVSRLARQTGISRQTIQEWLAGTNPRDITKVKKVADALGVSVDDLCFGTKQINSNPIQEFDEEINAGLFEVVLRRVKK